MINKRNLIPESEKIIIVYNNDCFGDYKIEGKFVDYKKPIKKGKKFIKSRFCTLDKYTNQYASNHQEFKTCNGWEYKQKPEAPHGK